MIEKDGIKGIFHYFRTVKNDFSFLLISPLFFLLIFVKRILSKLRTHMKNKNQKLILKRQNEFKILYQDLISFLKKEHTNYHNHFPEK